jgi:Inner membrane component of T3SS, cytoplasmic domain
MASPVDELAISPAELRAAVASRDLPGLVARLVRERSWGALILLFGYAGGPDGAASLGLGELDAAALALATTLDGVPPPKQRRAPLADELRAVRIAAAEALLARGAHPPLTEIERRAHRRAAALLAAAGDHARAAAAHEELGDDASAAAAWGALGDLDRMEAAHARDEARDDARRAAADLLRRFDVLLASGERRAAIALTTGLPPDAPGAGAARQRAASLEAALVRGRAVTLRVRGGPVVRLAVVPARLGRDPLVEVALRDPGVSRRHATIGADDAGLYVEDAGSRAGVLVAGARLEGRLRLRGVGELALGTTTSLRYDETADGRAVVLRGNSGLDRDLVIVAGQPPIDLGLAVPEARGLTLELAGGDARLARRADLPVRLGGHLAGPAFDLLRGELVEVLGATPCAFEVA